MNRRQQYRKMTNRGLSNRLKDMGVMHYPEKDGWLFDLGVLKAKDLYKGIWREAVIDYLLDHDPNPMPEPDAIEKVHDAGFLVKEVRPAVKGVQPGVWHMIKQLNAYTKEGASQKALNTLDHYADEKYTEETPVEPEYVFHCSMCDCSHYMHSHHDCRCEHKGKWTEVRANSLLEASVKFLKYKNDITAYGEGVEIRVCDRYRVLRAHLRLEVQ